MKVISLKIVLLLLLNACRTQPQSFIGTQCSPVYSYEDLAGVSYINVENSKCFCRQYKVSADYIGPMTDATNYPIDKCNKIIGYSPKEYVELNGLMEYVRQNLKVKTQAVPESSHR